MNKLSTAEKRKRKTLEKSRERKKTAPGIATKRKAPSYLQQAGKTAWEDAVNQLTERNVLDNADFTLLEEYASAVDMATQARRLIRAEGLMYEDKNGLTRRHPAFSVWKMSIEQAQKMAAKLTITAYDRARAPDPEQPEEEHDPIVELYKKWGKPLPYE